MQEGYIIRFKPKCKGKSYFFNFLLEKDNVEIIIGGAAD